MHSRDHLSSNMPGTFFSDIIPMFASCGLQTMSFELPMRVPKQYRSFIWVHSLMDVL